MHHFRQETLERPRHENSLGLGEDDDRRYDYEQAGKGEGQGLGLEGFKEREEETNAKKIPRSEQDEDLWRLQPPLPGRDPVTLGRGIGL